MSDSVKTGKKSLSDLTPMEAEEILKQCHLLRRDIDRLCVKAVKQLKPKLRVVE